MGRPATGARKNGIRDIDHNYDQNLTQELRATWGWGSEQQTDMDRGNEMISIVSASNRWHDVTASVGGARSFRVSWLIAAFLAARGIDRIFGLCGGHIQPIWDDVACLGIRIVDVRDERAAVHMAQAHSELTGEIGVAMVTAGPGMANAVTGIANAHVSRAPVLVISGCPPRPQQNMGALQEIPQAEIVRPITRYARTVREATHVIRELDDALAGASGQGGEKGPAYIDFPTDLLREELALGLVERDRFEPRAIFPVMPAAEAVKLAAELLWSARRLLVVSGRGAREAGPQIIRLIDALGCAYVDTAESRGLVPDSHPAFMPAMRGRVMQEADLVLTVGRCLDAQLGYGSPAVFPGARFLRIGTSTSEVRGNRRGEVEIFGSVPEVLQAIVEVAGTRPAATDRAWIEELRAKDRKRREDLEGEMSRAAPGRDGRMHPYRLLGSVRQALGPDAIVVADGGDILSFARVALSGTTYLDPGALGCLGVGVPYGIAAALACPGRQVVVITGDGAFGFNGMELETAKRHNARVVFVVAHNAAWNIERNDQIECYGGRIVGSELWDTDHAALAKSLGVHGERLERAEDLPAALEKAFREAPALIDVLVTRDTVSPDGRSGLPGVPDSQPLATWDRLEKSRN
jgi:acetolactate synthase-1/2/3 large subunit